MTISATISAVLKAKGTEVHTVTPETTVYKAIQMMDEKNVGAVVVQAEGKVVGMFSERDYTRKVVLRGGSSRRMKVQDIMTQPVITAKPDATVEECMRLMISHRVRHIPVLEQENLVGIVSIGDVVNWTISTQDTTISQLRHFITGQYPG